MQTVRARVIPDFTEFDAAVEERRASVLALLSPEHATTASMGGMVMYRAGDRVRVVSGEEHEEGMGGPGIVREVSTPALAIELDSMQGKIHRWYVASELEPLEEDEMRASLTAAVAPLAPPREWFEMEEPSEVTPMTYTDDGRVFGHLAPWDQCHAGLSAGAFSECVTAPRSASDYSRFHLGTLQTAEGEQIAVGKIVLATGHASMSADITAATKHYDDTGSVGAFVRARNGQRGIWASGVVRSDLSAEQLRDLRANPVSGDWRSYQGTLELVAALAVPVPGFPIPRAQLSLAASGEIAGLILTPVEYVEPVERDRAFIRRRNAILASLPDSVAPVQD